MQILSKLRNFFWNLSHLQTFYFLTILYRNNCSKKYFNMFSCNQKAFQAWWVLWNSGTSSSWKQDQVAWSTTLTKNFFRETTVLHLVEDYESHSQKLMVEANSKCNSLQKRKLHIFWGCVCSASAQNISTLQKSRTVCCNLKKNPGFLLFTIPFCWFGHLQHQKTVWNKPIWEKKTLKSLVNQTF